MKKTFIAIAAVIIASASIFWACSKDSENEEVKNVTNKNFGEFFETDPGILHNELLKNDMLTPGYFSRNETERLMLAFEFCQRNNLFINLSFDEFVNNIDTLKSTDNISLLDLAIDIANENNFCDKYIYFAEKLNSLENVDNDTYFEQLSILKSEIVANDELNFEEKYSLLGAISIAINSGLFWENEYPEIIKNIMMNKDCPRYPRDPNLSNCENAKIRWADVKGWFKNNKMTRSCSAYSASAKKHNQIINDHNELYEDGK